MYLDKMAPRSKAAKVRNTQQDDDSMDEDPIISDEESGDDIEATDGPPVIDPYEVLELQKEATAEDVKKAYRNKALKHHPGEYTAHKHRLSLMSTQTKLPRARKKPRTRSFKKSLSHMLFSQTTVDAGATISLAAPPKHSKTMTSLTGSSFIASSGENAVNEEAIEKFSNEYKGSDAERQDLIKAYKKAKGKLAAVYELVMLSDILIDDDRYRQIFDEEISKGTIESYPAYAKETDATREKAKKAERKRREDFEIEHAKDAEEDDTGTEKTKAKSKPKAKKKAAGDMTDLAAMIQQRQKARAGNFFDHLEAKYAPKSRGSKRSTPMEEPPEEAFLATAARKKQKSNGRAKKAKPVDEDEEMDLDEEDIDKSDEEEEEEEVKPRKSKTKSKAKGRGRATAKT